MRRRNRSELSRGDAITNVGLSLQAVLNIRILEPRIFLAEVSSSPAVAARHEKYLPGLAILLRGGGIDQPLMEDTYLEEEHEVGVCPFKPNTTDTSS